MNWMYIFSNEWFVGIVCGIVSGIVVYWITSRIYSKKQNKEYQQRVKAANNEILYAIRPLVVDQTLPTVNVWNALINSTSKKYQVRTEDLYSVNTIKNDIITEVLENPFLSTEKKKEYTSIIESFSYAGDKWEVSDELLVEIERIRKHNKNKGEELSLVMSIVIGLTTGISTAFIDNDLPSNKTTIVITLIAILVVAAIASFIIYHNTKNSNKRT